MKSNNVKVRIDDIMYISIVLVIPVLCLVNLIMINTQSVDEYEINNYKTYYAYIDLDNNEGIADECKHDRTPICELEDGTIIAVKQYKRIRESKGE